MSSQMERLVTAARKLSVVTRHSDVGTLVEGMGLAFYLARHHPEWVVLVADMLDAQRPEDSELPNAAREFLEAMPVHGEIANL